MRHYTDLVGPYRIEIIDNRDTAPLIEYMTEDGPAVGVHPSVRGLSIIATNIHGAVFHLDTFSTTTTTDADYDRAYAFASRIERHLASGKDLNPAHWTFVRVEYGTPAYEDNFAERLGAHITCGGTLSEFLANN